MFRAIAKWRPGCEMHCGELFIQFRTVHFNLIIAVLAQAVKRSKYYFNHRKLHGISLKIGRSIPLNAGKTVNTLVRIYSSGNYLRFNSL